jgi:hypothetical protein
LLAVAAALALSRRRRRRWKLVWKRCTEDISTVAKSSTAEGVVSFPVIVVFVLRGQNREKTCSSEERTKRKKQGEESCCSPVLFVSQT